MMKLNRNMKVRRRMPKPIHWHTFILLESFTMISPRAPEGFWLGYCGGGSS